MPHVTRFLAFRCGMLALAALALPALLTGAVAPTATEPAAPPVPAAHGSLTGQLLIASPDMRDPRFDHAVILVVRHDREGALGLVINMPLGERPLAELLAATGETGAGDTKVRVFVGGPVQPEVALVLHSAEYRGAGTLAIDGRLAVTGDPQILRDMAAKTGPQKSLLCLGYAGWAPGQLEGEIARRSWTTVPADGKLIFDEDREKLWDIVYALRVQDL